jgi:hypothetical protein
MLILAAKTVSSLSDWSSYSNLQRLSHRTMIESRTGNQDFGCRTGSYVVSSIGLRIDDEVIYEMVQLDDQMNKQCPTTGGE